jgi:hypothetical protein
MRSSNVLPSLALEGSSPFFVMMVYRSRSIEPSGSGRIFEKKDADLVKGRL